MKRVNFTFVDKDTINYQDIIKLGNVINAFYAELKDLSDDERRSNEKNVW